LPMRRWNGSVHKHSNFSERISHPLLKEKDWVAFSHPEKLFW